MQIAMLSMNQALTQGLITTVKRSVSDIAIRFSLDWQNTLHYIATTLAVASCLACFFSGHIFLALSFALLAAKTSYDAYQLQKLPELSDLKLRVGELAQVKEDLQTEVERLSSANKKFKARISDFRQENATYHTHNLHLQKSLETLTTENATYKTQNTLLQASIKLFEQENVRFQGSNEQLEHANTTFQTSNTTLQEQITHLTEHSTQQKTHIDTLEQTITALQQQKTAHENLIKQHKQETNRLQAVTLQFAQERATFQEELQGLKTSLQNHEAQVATLSSSNAALGELIDKLGIHEHNFKETQGGFAEQIALMTAQTDDLRKILHYIQNSEAKNQLLKICTQIEQQVTNAHGQLGYLMGMKDRTLQDIQEVTTQLQQLQEKVQHTATQLESAATLFAATTPQSLQLVQELQALKTGFVPAQHLQIALADMEKRLHAMQVPATA